MRRRSMSPAACRRPATRPRSRQHVPPRRTRRRWEYLDTWKVKLTSWIYPIKTTYNICMLYISYCISTTYIYAIYTFLLGICRFLLRQLLLHIHHMQSSKYACEKYLDVAFCKSAGAQAARELVQDDDQSQARVLANHNKGHRSAQCRYSYT